MNNYCSNCGNEIQVGASFCCKCGFNFNGQQHNINNNKNNINNLKIVSLILGIIAIVGSFIFNIFIIPMAIVGLVFGIIYCVKEKKFCAGIILNILGIIIPIVIICLLAVITNSLISDVNENVIDTNFSENSNLNDNYWYDDEYDIDNGDYNNDNTLNNNVIYNNYLTEINFNELLVKFENKEDFVLLLSQTTCGHCNNFKPKIEDVANDYKIKVFYIEVNLLNDNEYDMLNSYINFSGTPTTVFILDGEIDTEKSKIVGDSTVDKIISVFKSNGFI